MSFFSNSTDNSINDFKVKVKRTNKNIRKILKEKFTLNKYVETYDLKNRLSINAINQIKKYKLIDGLDFLSFDCLSKHIHKDFLEIDIDIIHEKAELRKQENYKDIIELVHKKFYGSFLKYFQYQKELEVKKNYIPNELFFEVENLVKNSYGDNWELYFNDIHQYFDTMTFQKFQLATANNTGLRALTDTYEKTGRATRSKQRKNLHHISVLLKLISFDRASYISKSQENLYKKSIVKQQEFIKNMAMVGTDGQIINLSNVTKNKKQYIAEKINCIRTMELFAVERGYTWSFVTLTLDGDYIACPKFKKKGHKYNGIAYDESAKILAKDWNNIRANLKVQKLLPSVSYFGATTSEAMRNGIRHIHLIIFHHINDLHKIRHAFFTAKPNLKEQVLMAEMEVNKLNMMLKAKAINQMDYDKKLKDVKNPWRMCDVSKIEDKSKLGAVNYCFKYIMKSMSCFDENFDVWADHDAETTNAIKNNAFRNALSIRGVSFFGFENCLSKFRQLARKLARYSEDDQIHFLGINYRLEEIIRNNNLYAFIKEGHHKLIKNKYIITQSGNKKLVGFVIDNINYIKNTFVMAVKSIVYGWQDDDVDEGVYYNKKNEVNTDIYKQLAEINSNFTKSSILVKHNNSSKERKSKNKVIFDDKITFKWILQHPSLFLS